FLRVRPGLPYSVDFQSRLTRTSLIPPPCRDRTLTAQSLPQYWRGSKPRLLPPWISKGRPSGPSRCQTTAPPYEQREPFSRCASFPRGLSRERVSPPRPPRPPWHREAPL